MITAQVIHEERFLPEDWLTSRTERLAEARRLIETGAGKGGRYTGWVDYPAAYDKDELERVLAAAKEIREKRDALVVIGIGGSYLGARAVLELVRGANHNLYGDGCRILFAGNSLSADGYAELLNYLSDKDFAINVISKSGSTTEPGIAFALLYGALEERFGAEGAKERTYITTDPENGLLRDLVHEKGYESFTIPDSVGGRYSVLTSVGLFPLAVGGVNVRALLEGAAEMRKTCRDADGAENPAFVYAAARNALYAKGYGVELMGCFEPSYRFFGEWYKQLFGESIGKEHKGLFPASVEFTADLHSLGQFIQGGSPILFETIVRFEQSLTDRTIDTENWKGFEYLSGKSLNEINECARLGTLAAHTEGGVPNILLTAPDRRERSVGQLIYFFEYACALCGYLIDVNPFDQPDVEGYKKSMYRLLGKPGHTGEKR